MNIKKKETEYQCDNNIFRILIVLLVLFIFLYFYRLGSIGLIDVDEPRYAEAGREMLELNNWIVPCFNYVPRYDKPIFYYWLEAVFMKAFGISEFSARIPSVLSALLCISMVYYLLKTFYGYFFGLIGSLILVSSFEFAALARFSIPDMTLCAFITSSLICFFLGYNYLLNSARFVKDQVLQFTYWYPLGFMFLALAFLTKGPVSIVIVGLILFPFFWWVGQIDYFFKSRSFWAGLFLFLLLVLPWYTAVHFATGGEFTKIFFGLHNIMRYTSVVSGHKGSVFYFVGVILIGFLPWTFFLPQAVYGVLKKGLKNLLNQPKEKLPWFALWWLVVVFVFFSLSKTKLLTYILSLFPALSILVSHWFCEIFKKHLNKGGLIVGMGVFFVFCLIIFYICLFHLNILLPREVKCLKVDFQIMFLAFLLLVGVSMSWASSHKDEAMTLIILVSTFLLLYFSFVAFLMPKIDRHSQYLLRTFAKSVPQEVEVATYQIIKPSLTFYAKRKTEKINAINKIQKKLNQQNNFAFVAKKELIKDITFDNSYLWGMDSRYVIYTNYPSNP